MTQSLAQVYLHIVFSTKNRRAFLQDKELCERTHAYLVGACRNLDSPSIITGGISDHVHILCSLSRKLTIAALIAELKRESSIWIKTQGSDLARFHWQEGYGAFSVSPSHIADLQHYIRNQERHHRHRETFQDEFRRLLAKYEIAYDERYVWD